MLLVKWHDWFMCVKWHIMCDMTYSYVWHDSFICVAWLSESSSLLQTRSTRVTRSVLMLLGKWHDWFMCVTWRVPMCDMTYSYVWTWLLHKFDMTDSYVWHDLVRVAACCRQVAGEWQQRADAARKVTWLIHVLEMTCPHGWYVSANSDLLYIHVHCFHVHNNWQR